MGTTLGEDIALLAITEDGTVAGGKLRFALAGAELVQLAAAGRVDVVDGRIHVLDATPTGEKLLDTGLRDIQSDKRPPHATRWVSRPRSLVDAYLEQLVARGIVRRETRKVLRIFLTVRWIVIDSAAAAWARERLDAVAFSVEPVGTIDAGEAAFGALVHTAGLSNLIYPDARNAKFDAARSRLKQIAQRDQAANTVHDAAERQAADAAFNAAVNASMEAAISASVHATHHAAHDGGGAGGGGHH